MSDLKGFDPQVFVKQPEVLGDTADAAEAAALKFQRTLHRQRLGAAQKALARAQAAGDRAEVARLSERVALRTERVTRAEEHFAVANVAKPVPESQLAQVIVVVVGDAKAPPLTAALLGAGGKIGAETPVLPSGGAVFTFEQAQTGLRLQISDATGQVLFRDAEGFDVALGQVVERAARLSGQVKDPAPAPETISMPDLSGLSESAACAILFRLGVRDIDIKRRASDGPVGVVIGQTPSAGQELKPESGAVLVISEHGETPDPGGDELEMPNFIGRPIEAALKAARALKLKLATAEVASDAPKGQVIGQKPEAGAILTPPFAADVTVSAGPGEPDVETVVIPDLVGMQADEAKAIADSRKIGLKVTERESGRPKNEVIGQSPPADTVVPRPVTMSLIVSTGSSDSGPTKVRIPNFVGQEISAVSAVAERMGISLTIRRVKDGGQPGLVSAQKPDAGTEVELPAKVQVDVSVDAPDPGNFTRFQRDLAGLVRRDQRFSGLGLTPARLLQGLQGIDNLGDAEKLIETQNAGLAQRFGLANLNLARTLRSILKQALGDLG